jgi:hypothetical protein
LVPKRATLMTLTSFLGWFSAREMASEILKNQRPSILAISSHTM